MVEPTLEHSHDTLGGMDIRPFDISDDAVRRIEEDIKVPKGNSFDVLARQEEESDALSEFSATGLSSIGSQFQPNKRRESLETQSDAELINQGLDAYDENDFESALNFFAQVRDKAILYDHLEHAINGLISNSSAASSSHEIALKFAALIGDEDQREREVNYIKSLAVIPEGASGAEPEGEDPEDEKLTGMELKEVADVGLSAFQPSTEKVEDPGRVVQLRKIKSNDDESGTSLTDKDLADRFLSYQDADLPSELKAQMREYNDGSESAKKYTQALRELINTYGQETVEDLANGMMEDCEDTLNKLGIEPNKFTQSKTWAIWDIAKQYYYFTHQDKADPEYVIANPMDSITKQQEIIDRHVGWEVYNQPNKLEIAEVVKEVTKRDQLMQYLNKAPKTNGTLSSKDLAKIGEIISGSFNLSNTSEPEPGSVLEAKAVPPEVPPAVESGALTPPEAPTAPIKNEAIEANFEKLREARDAYATAYTEWEYRKRNSTKLWEKTMFALGVSKPAPERLSLRTADLEDAREEYLKARVVCGKETSNTYKENYERATEEMLLLQEAMLNARMVRENSDADNRKMADEMIPKTKMEKVSASLSENVRSLSNLWLKQHPAKKLLLAGTLVTGSYIIAAPVLGTAGLRVARGVAGVTMGAITGGGLGKMFDRRNAVNEELSTSEYAGNINPENFAEWESKKLQEFENSQNTKRFQRAIKVGAAVAVGGATAYGSGSYLKSMFGHNVVENLASTANFDTVPVKDAVANVSGVVETVDTKLDLASSDLVKQIHGLKSDILVHYHGGAVPADIQKNILDVPTDKLLEQLHLVDTEHNASAGNLPGGHIVFDGNKVVYEQGGITRDLYDPKIGVDSKTFSKVDFGGSKKVMPDMVNQGEQLLGDPIITADEIKPNDPGFGTIEVKPQEPVLVDENKIGVVPEPLVDKNHLNVAPESGLNIYEQPFENAKISVIRGTQGDPNHLIMMLDGKEVATGSVKSGVPKLTIHPELKGGLFTDTVYERAFKALNKQIKTGVFQIK
jgi:hypothetical protein